MKPALSLSRVALCLAALCCGRAASASDDLRVGVVIEMTPEAVN